eukprot:3522696-Alexandrium_andersonii.AAC.1
MSGSSRINLFVWERPQSSRVWELPCRSISLAWTTEVPPLTVALAFWILQRYPAGWRVGAVERVVFVLCDLRRRHAVPHPADRQDGQERRCRSYR